MTQTSGTVFECDACAKQVVATRSYLPKGWNHISVRSGAKIGEFHTAADLCEVCSEAALAPLLCVFQKTLSRALEGTQPGSDGTRANNEGGNQPAVQKGETP